MYPIIPSHPADAASSMMTQTPPLIAPLTCLGFYAIYGWNLIKESENSRKAAKLLTRGAQQFSILNPTQNYFFMRQTAHA